MSQPKELIPVAKLQALVEALACIQKDLDRAARNTVEDDLPGVYMEGWKMMNRSLLELQKQAAKITGQASRTANLDLSQIALDEGESPTVEATEKKLDARRKTGNSKD